MTSRRLTDAEMKADNRAYRQLVLSWLTLGLIPKPEAQREPEAGS
jgi:hypothetical protein